MPALAVSSSPYQASPKPSRPSILNPSNNNSRNSLFHVAEDDDVSEVDTPVDQRPQHHNQQFYADPSYSKILGSHAAAPHIRLSPSSSPFNGSAISSDEEDDDPGSNVGSQSVDRIRLAVETPPPLIRSGSVGNSWGISGVGRGFASWTAEEDSPSEKSEEEETGLQLELNAAYNRSSLDGESHVNDPEEDAEVGILGTDDNEDASMTNLHIDLAPPPLIMDPIPPSRASPNPSLHNGWPPPADSLTLDTSDALRAPPLLRSQTLPHISSSPLLSSPLSSSPSSLALHAFPTSLTRPNTPRSNSIAISPRLSRRRDLQNRISLIAGRIVPVVVPPLTRPHDAVRSRWPSSTCLAPPTKDKEAQEEHDEKPGRSIDDFIIFGEAGRGAYGLVKRVKEVLSNGSLGVCGPSPLLFPPWLMRGPCAT